MKHFIACLSVSVSIAITPVVACADGPWKRHAIDNRHQGADGVRLGDFNGDGLSDVVTGWEESGLVKLYLNPGPVDSKSAWPATMIGKAKSPEDAVPIDLDDDGHLDIVSCHEGKQRQVLVHWNDAGTAKWTTDRFGQLDGVMWMFALPLGKIDTRTALAVGAKGPNASITLLISPADDSRQLNSWTVIRLRDAGWIMSLRSIDMDGDGDRDIVFSDRKSNLCVAGWLEQPDDPEGKWNEHQVAAKDKEVMFLTATKDRWLIAMRESQYLDCRRTNDGWDVVSIDNPPGVINGKAIEMLPDGRVIMTANTAASPNPELPGIWIRDTRGRWSAIDPTPKVKFDRMELIDLDGDGDLDVMTCEERQNLGVIWYENPER
ncbi:MAG: VCBS repeat-containing protein [Planctomycetales bacterium]|nr:VCBS repeat-containing protein [Planctomycetales bacterium]